MKKVIISIIAILSIISLAHAITLKDLTISASHDNTSLTFDKAVNTSNFTTSNTYVSLSNFTFNKSEGFFINTTTNVTSIDILNWSKDVNVNSSNFINYFRFNNTDTGSLISDFTFGNFTTTDNQLEVFFTNYETEGIKNWIFDKVGLVESVFSYNFSWDTTNNITFQADEAKIIVKIFDRDTRTLLTGQNVSLTLIDSVGDSAVTNTGTHNFSSLNFVDSEYHVISETEGYSTEVFYFDYDNQEQVNVNVYMVNQSTSDAGSITINVKDDFGQFVPGAICRAKQWVPSESAYTSVSEEKTNVNGNAVLNIEIGTKEYIFECSKDGLTASTPPEIIKADLDTRNLRLVPSQAKTTEFLQGFTYTITESVLNNVSNITFDYSDTKKEVTRGCITFYDVSGISKTQIAQTCANSADATIFESFNINNSFPVKVEVSVQINNNLERVIETFNYDGENSINKFLESFGFQIFIPTLLIILGLGLGIIMNNIYISLSLMIIMSWVSVFIVPSVMSGSIATIVTGFIAITIWGGYKPR